MELYIDDDIELIPSQCKPKEEWDCLLSDYYERVKAKAKANPLIDWNGRAKHYRS